MVDGHKACVDVGLLPEGAGKLGQHRPPEVEEGVRDRCGHCRELDSI